MAGQSGKNTNWSELRAHTHLTDGWAPELTPQTPKENPALFKAAMQVFLKAGTQILRPTSPEGVKLCREIRRKDCQVWATVLPAGKILKLQEMEEAEFANHFEEQVKKLAKAKPDAILIQSMTDLNEAVIALLAAKKVCRLPVGVAMTFGSGPDQTDTVMGFTCEQATGRLQDEGADLIGCNCRIAIDEMVLVVRLMRQNTQLPILACPDAGQKELDGPQIVYRETPEEFASKAGSLINAGADVIGGCCGVGPDFIKQVAETIRTE